MREKVSESERESRIDVCVECYVRDRDFSHKKVRRCKLCDRWFCERHIEPRLAFIRDLEAVEKSPQVRLLYHTEMSREDGHPDFEYSRRKFTELEIEERRRNELIKQALDRMNHYYDDVEIPEKPINVEESRKRTVEILLKEEEEIEKNQRLGKEASQSYYNPQKESETTTLSNGFVVPSRVYSNAEYREYLNHAKTMKSIRVIVDEYYEKYGYRKYGKREKSEEPEKKKHWWQ